MNERQQARLDHLLNELVALREEGAELYQTIREKRAKMSAMRREIEAMRSDVLRDMNRFANLSQTMRQIEDEVRLLRRS
ncbi:MAG: hypothetical protein IS632_05625 [Thaumarchaeota archaeon]|nr:hypothetical protein [Nitrososphaerota archaeon]